MPFLPTGLRPLPWLVCACVRSGLDRTREAAGGAGSAFLFTAENMPEDAPRTDSVRLSRLPFLAAAPRSIAMLPAGLPAILYAGIFSSGIACTLQILGQEGVNPAVASLVMSLESVFGTISGWLILHETLSLRELAGCGLMFGSILLAQIEPPRRPRSVPEPSRNFPRAS